MKAIRDMNLVISVPRGGSGEGGENYEIITNSEIDNIFDNQ